MRYKNQCIWFEHHGSTQPAGLISQPSLIPLHPQIHCSPLQHSYHTDPFTLHSYVTDSLNFGPCCSFTSSLPIKTLSTIWGLNQILLPTSFWRLSWPFQPLLWPSSTHYLYQLFPTFPFLFFFLPPWRIHMPDIHSEYDHSCAKFLVTIGMVWSLTGLSLLLGSHSVRYIRMQVSGSGSFYRHTRKDALFHQEALLTRVVGWIVSHQNSCLPGTSEYDIIWKWRLKLFADIIN